MILPHEHLGWIVGQPDDVLSQRTALDKRFAFKWLIPTFDVHDDLFLTDVIRRDLTRNLGRVQADMFDEMRQSIDATMGLDSTSWSEFNLVQAMRSIVFRSSNRVLLGPSLCRNQEYQKSSQNFSSWLGASAIVIGQLVPWFLSSFLGHLVAIPVYICRNRAFKFLVPEIKERMDTIKRKRMDPSHIYDEPKDLITWYVNAILDSDSTKHSTPEALADRLLFLVSPFS